MKHIEPPLWMTILLIMVFIILITGCGFHIYLHNEGWCHCPFISREPVNKSGHEKYYFLNLIFKSRH